MDVRSVTCSGDDAGVFEGLARHAFEQWGERRAEMFVQYFVMVGEKDGTGHGVDALRQVGDLLTEQGDDIKAVLNNAFDAWSGGADGAFVACLQAELESHGIRLTVPIARGDRDSQPPPADDDTSDEPVEAQSESEMLFSLKELTDLEEGTAKQYQAKAGTPRPSTNPQRTERDQSNPFMQEVNRKLDRFVGMDGVKDQVRKLVNVLLVNRERERQGMRNASLSLHMVFEGPPGTGKTTIARVLGEIYAELGFLERGHTIEVGRDGLVAGYTGQTGIKVAKVIKKAMGGVLFIDEAYSLDAEGDSYGREAIDVLLKKMEDLRGQLAVIVAGYPTEMAQFLLANPGLKSRFNRTFRFDHYSPEEMLRIFKGFCAESDRLLTPTAAQVLLSYLARIHELRDDHFGNGREVRNLFDRIVEEQADRIVGSGADRTALRLLTDADVRVVCDAYLDQMGSS
jgi:SpoVK/Ycf46/Vps4 family AAA+-type ATPase